MLYLNSVHTRGVLHVLHTCIQQPERMRTKRLFRITLRLAATRIAL